MPLSCIASTRPSECIAITGWTCRRIYSGNGASCGNGDVSAARGQTRMLGFIRNTSTKTGLVVTAYLDRKEYPTGLEPDRQLISSLALKPGKVLPRWSYTSYTIALNL